jgi:glycosyltransferase involved in cell wall biosynthesis
MKNYYINENYTTAKKHNGKLRMENSKAQYFFSIFTPTYNRAYRLPKLFESLQKQEFVDFEWIVVDDGSTDNTAGLIEQCKQEAKFSITYIKTENGGKHRAINKGVNLAKGEWFVVVDSDDWLVDDALRLICDRWNNLSKLEQNGCHSIFALKMYPNGNIIGEKFPSYKKMSSLFDIAGIRGDKFFMFKTQYFKQFPFKEFVGEKYIAEGSVYIKYAQAFEKAYLINVPLRVCEYLSDGLTAKSNHLRRESINSSLYTYLTCLRFSRKRSLRIRAIINYHRFLLHALWKKAYIYDEVKLPLTVWNAFIFFGFILFVRDKGLDIFHGCCNFWKERVHYN